MTPNGLPPRLAADLQRQYDIIRLLGQGGMGTVWLARERSLDRLVAIKVLADENVTTPGMRERFRREARIAARLLHPNIVPLFAFGETADALYFAMGYVEGESLAARLDRDGRLPRAEAIRVLSEIADALSFAHREGVVHRDVKPENILLDARSGRALLADFGIARFADAAGTTVTQAGMAVGTPSYMSPEQVTGARDVDGRADIYSLGIVAYRMLLGRLPFAGGAQQLMAQHATTKPADLALAVPASERKLAEVIMCAIEKDPQARWARAEDLRDELQTLAREGSDLPDELQRVEMILTKFLAADVAIVAIFYLWGVWDPQGAREFGTGWEMWAFLAANLAALPALGIAWAIPTIRKFGWRDTLRAMLHPPRGWVHWWPRALRRADDIWDRLPKPLRRLRNVIDGVATYLILDITLFLLVATTGGGAYGDWFWAVMRKFEGVGLWVHGAIRGLLPIAWVGYEFLRARKKLGVTFRDLTQLLKTPHLADDPGWNKPKFARLLGGVADTRTAMRASQSPEELVRSIRVMTARLVRSGILPDDEGARAADAVLQALAALEGEIARLHQDLDPVELERLDRRLAALTSSEEDAELRKLLQGQQALLRQLEHRREQKEAKRDRLREQLVSLHLHLLELDGRLTRGAAADPELTSRVRALTSELGHLGEAMSEVDRMLLPERTLEVTPT